MKWAGKREGTRRETGRDAKGNKKGREGNGKERVGKR